MGGLILIVPVLALDIWLGCTTGKRRLSLWRAFLLQYHADSQLLKGFPIPWAGTTLPGFVACLGAAADFLTGLAAPLIPFKIAEFLSEVKAELK